MRLHNSEYDCFLSREKIYKAEHSTSWLTAVNIDMVWYFGSALVFIYSFATADLLVFMVFIVIIFSYQIDILLVANSEHERNNFNMYLNLSFICF